MDVRKGQYVFLDDEAGHWYGCVVFAATPALWFSRESKMKTTALGVPEKTHP